MGKKSDTNSFEKREIENKKGNTGRDYTEHWIEDRKKECTYVHVQVKETKEEGLLAVSYMR
jgi:hypothetical protein